MRTIYCGLHGVRYFEWDQESIYSFSLWCHLIGQKKRIHSLPYDCSSIYIHWSESDLRQPRGCSISLTMMKNLWIIMICLQILLILCNNYKYYMLLDKTFGGGSPHNIVTNIWDCDIIVSLNCSNTTSFGLNSWRISPYDVVANMLDYDIIESLNSTFRLNSWRESPHDIVTNVLDFDIIVRLNSCFTISFGLNSWSGCPHGVVANVLDCVTSL